MILVNGCSHTHGTNHAELKNYKDKLWPNIAGEIIGDTDVINLAKGGDSAMCIADSTIHWLETNTIKPDMVIIQWTYHQRFELPYHRKYADDPFRDWATAEPISHGEEPPVSDSWVYLEQYPREGINWLTSTGIYVNKDQNDMLQKKNVEINHLGLTFPEILFQAGFKQDIHPYFLGEHDDPRIQNIIDYYKRYVDYREAVCNLPTTREYTIHKWAMAQNWVASYCEANNIPYYWWGVDSWRQPDMADVFYLKPKYGTEMFGNIKKIDWWLEKQGIMSNGDMIARPPGEGNVIVTEENKHLITDKTNVYVDDHRGEDGHYYIGEMIANYILHGIQPDPNAEDREYCKKIMLEKPNLLKNPEFKQIRLDPKYKELWRYATEPGYEYRPKAINPPRFFYE